MKYLEKWHQQGVVISDVLGRAQSPKPGQARPIWARPSPAQVTGLKWALAGLSTQESPKPELEPGL